MAPLEKFKQIGLPAANLFIGNDNKLEKLATSKRIFRELIVESIIFDKLKINEEILPKAEGLMATTWQAISEDDNLSGLVHEIDLQAIILQTDETIRPYYGATLLVRIKYLTEADSLFGLITTSGKYIN